MRFLVSRLSALGDTVCTLPVARALKATFPGCHLTWVVDPRFAGVVECCPDVDEILRVKPGIAPRKWPRIDDQFDVAFDMQGLLKSAIVVGRARAPRKLGYHWQREGAWLFSQRVLPDPSSRHVVDQYVDVVRAAGALADRAEFGLVPLEKDLDSVRLKLKEDGVDGAFVLMNPGAGWASKRWPAAHFGRVVDGIADMGIQSVLIGGKSQEDLEIARGVSDACEAKPILMTGKTSVRELIALVSLCRAHLGGDTGSTHIAAALGVPTVGLYSITNPIRTGPYGQVDRCLHHPEGIASISAERALERLEEAVRCSHDGAPPHVS
jgi:heptosyltransferase I